MPDLFEFAHKHRDEIAWMSQNTNTIPLAPAIRDAIRQSVDEAEYNLYPYKSGIFGLPEAVKDDLRLPDHEIILTNGGLEGTYMATRALLGRGDEVLSTDPSFLPIHHQMTLTDATINAVDIYRKPWKLTVDQANEALTPATKMLFLVDPHNPLGFSYTRAEKKGLAELAVDHDLLILDDVTYRDFDPDHTLASEFAPDHTIVSHTFSKGPGLAGLRIGALLAPQTLMRRIRPYTVNVLGANVLGQRAALAALRHKAEWLEVVRTTCKRNQETIRAAVEAVEGCFLPVYPSKANMFVVDVSATGAHPDSIEERLLLEYNVHIRAGSYLSPASGTKFVRVSFTVPPQDAVRFSEAFPQVMAALGA